MKKNKHLVRLVALALALLLLLTLIVPAFAVGGGDTILIKDADDLLAFSRNCTLDTWSRGKTAVLQADISLEGMDFSPIPTFGGTFDGSGHTISGLAVSGSATPAGLFGILQEGAVVKNLTVIGSVVPAGDAVTLGGIAGVNHGKLTNCVFQGFVSGSSTVGGVVGLNEATGQLINCSFQGAVVGEHYVGGIAGWNTGSLIQCVNSGSINTTVIDVKAELSSLNLRDLRSTESIPAGTDIGGIAGFSTGLLQSCKNTGDVGYEHMGYNVGGIVGRQSGYLDGCVNRGTIRGRKDVGGIAGQLEPQVTLKYSEDVLSGLWDELDVLEELMDRALRDAESAADSISGRMDDLTASVGTVKDTASGLSDAMADWANSNIGQINDASARLSWVLSQMEPILDDIGDALEQTETAVGQFTDALDEAGAAGELGTEAVAELRQALEDLQTASSYGRKTFTHVKNAMTSLKNSLGDEEQTQGALKDLVSALSDLSGSFSTIAGSTARIGAALDRAEEWVRTDPAWIQLREGVAELQSALTEISAALTEIGSALERIAEIGATEENLALLSSAAGHLSAAVTHLSNAYSAFSAALNAYNAGEMGDARTQLDQGVAELGLADTEITAAQQDISVIVENIENNPDLQPALEDLKNALSRLNAGIAAANDAIVKINGALEQLEESEVPEETMQVIREELPVIREALRDADDASRRIGAALDVLKENFDASEVEAAWEELENAADDLERCAGSLGRAVDHMAAAMEYLEAAGAHGSAAVDSLSRASATMEKAISLLRQATERTADVVAELAEKPAIQFEPIGSDLTERGDALDDALSQMLDQVSTLNGTMTSASDLLLSDLRAINRQVGVIIDLLRKGTEEAREAEASDHFEDISDQELSDDQTSGRISAARNTGTVEGDINVAGVVGSIAIEYDFDPEDDLTKDGSRSLDFRYQTAAVVRDSVNEGTITAKKDYAGSVVGRMDLGTVSACQGCGSVESSSGDYVGGIAGLTSGTIRGSFAKCTLEGDRYVGGIVGSGTAAGTGSSASIVSGCYSMVSIPRYKQYAGAVSGGSAGTFTDNYFVSDTLAGIDRASYSGQAEPIAYAALPWETMPKAFRQLSLRFIADDETLKILSFNYGQSFDESVYPALPQKEGYYAHWDKTDLQSLHFDTDVTAVYERYTTALPSAETRSSGRPIFFAEGQFDEGAALTVTAQANSPSDFDVLPTDFRDFAVQCFSGAKVSREIVEQWSIDIPVDSLDTHTVRYLPPDGDPEDLDVYVHQDGVWTKVEAQTVGSYLTFPVSGSHAEIAVLSTLSVWWIWLIAAAVLVLVLALIIRLIRRIRKARRPVRTVPPNPEEERVHAYAGAAVGASAQAYDFDPDMDRIEFDSIGKEVPPVYGYPTPPGVRIPPPPPDTTKRKKKRWLPPLLIALALLAAAGFILSPLGTDLRDGLMAYGLLRQCAQQQELTMELSVQAEIGGRAVDLSAQVDRTQLEGRRVTRVARDEIRLYYTDGVVFLENGNAYRLTGAFPDYSQLLELALPLYRFADMEVTESAGQTAYTVTVRQEKARELLEILMPSVSDGLSGLDTVTVALAADGREVSELRFSSDGALNDTGQTPFSVSAVLRMGPASQESVSLPQSVRNAILSGDYKNADDLTDDLVRLASAWQELNERDPLSAQINLRADCGPLVLRDDLELDRWTEDGGRQICRIRKNGRALYFTDTFLCGENGEAVTGTEAGTVDAAQLLEIACLLCMNADLDCSASGTEYTYSLSLDKEGMESVVHAIAPATEKMDLLFDAGTLRLVIQDGAIESIRFSCTGDVDVVLSSVAAAFEAEVRFTDEAADLTLPDAVRRVLT